MALRVRYIRANKRCCFFVLLVEPQVQQMHNPRSKLHTLQTRQVGVLGSPLTLSGVLLQKVRCHGWVIEGRECFDSSARLCYGLGVEAQDVLRPPTPLKEGLE